MKKFNVKLNNLFLKLYLLEVVQNYAYLFCFGFSAQEEEKRARTCTETQRTGENKLNNYFKFSRTLVYL